MSAPDLRVIDMAIERIRFDANHHSCAALAFGLGDLGCYSRSLAEEYKRQYKLWTFKNGGRPKWWNSGRPYKRARIAALKSFRQACIDAASKQCNA